MFLPIFDPNHKKPSSLSYKIMRRMVGILGISLPIIIIIWTFSFSLCPNLLVSISAYYHTDMRDILVGILCAVSFFLFSYHGYDLVDFIIFKVTSLSCLGIAFFPVYIPSSIHNCLNPNQNQSSLSNIIHSVSASIFFSLLAFISIFLFTKTSPDTKKEDISIQKKHRNIVYILCGVIIIICILLLAAVHLLTVTDNIMKINPIFWLETFALFSFGISWLVKGEVVLKDQEQ